MERTRKKLKLSCGSSRCEDDLHCFRQSSKLGTKFEQGACQSCGEECVDWKRVHAKLIEDVEFTIRMLRFEYIRNYFWSKQRLNDKSLRYALRKGLSGLEIRASGHLSTSIGSEKPFHDGWQTPIDDEKIQNPYQYAQHATATCCRACLEYWHGIPKGIRLDSEQLEYLSSLVMYYVRQKIPKLPVEGMPNREANSFNLDLLYEHD